MNGSIVRFTASQCPYCGKRIDTASTYPGPLLAPRHGDCTVCFGCGGVLQFDSLMHLRPVKSAALLALDPVVIVGLRRIQGVVQAFLASDGDSLPNYGVDS